MAFVVAWARATNLAGGAIFAGDAKAAQFTGF